MKSIKKSPSRFLLKGAMVCALAMQGIAQAQSVSPPADQSSVTAIDILLEPDAVMIQHAEAANARLRSAFPNGFALDASHRPHITMLQRFVRTDDLDKVYAAANKVLATKNPTRWKLKAFKYYYIPDPPNGVAGIVAEPTEDLLGLQKELIDAVAPLHGGDWDRCSVRQRRGRPRHSTGLDRLRGQFWAERIRQEIQSPRHDWCRDRSLPKGDARGTVRGVRVLASGRVRIPAWQFWYGSEGTQGLRVEALTPGGLVHLPL